MALGVDGKVAQTAKDDRMRLVNLLYEPRIAASVDSHLVLVVHASRYMLLEELTLGQSVGG